MKKILSIASFFIIFFIQAQEKITLTKGEITIPIGKKILFKPEIKDNIIINFQVIKEENAAEEIDIFEMLDDFKKDNVKDNSIEITFSEAQMMASTIYALILVQKTGKQLVFKAKIRLKGNSSYQPTSIMPAASNAVHVEQWKDTIDSMILYDFELN
jgi:hypothetical protein